MRHVKRAVRADLHRFKAHVMMADEESGAWRGAIDDGEVKPRTRRRAVAAVAARARRRPARPQPRLVVAPQASSSR